jgi:exodeoxyribonuclease V alpha subunit
MRHLLDHHKAPRLIGEPDEYKPLLWAPPYLYPQKLWQYEAQLLQRLTQLLQRPLCTVPPDRLTEALDTLRRHPPRIEGAALALSAEQEYAVLTAVHNPVTLICGGPGTGKTSIVVFILRLLIHLGMLPHRIALAAPTGKAAQRLGVSIQQTLGQIEQPHFGDVALLHACPEPLTLHRLLGYSPGQDRFFYHANNRLAHRVVIVDEGSMIDLFLMERLVRALRDDVRLILLGDAEQLPSVDTGAVLRDLIPPQLDTRTPWGAFVRGRLPQEQADAPEMPFVRSTVRLRRSYRMRADDPAGRAILTLAGQINAGQTEAVTGKRKRRIESLTPRATVEALTFTQVEHLICADPIPVLAPFLRRWEIECLGGDAEIERFMQTVYPYTADGFAPADTAHLQHVFRHVERSRILCLTRVYDTGTEALNERLHASRCQALGLAQTGEFIPGEPVLMLRNDYDKRLFNGDQGLILRVAPPEQEPQPMAVFFVAGQFTAFHVTALRGQIALAFALTVHKSQGSEFDQIALILPESDIPLLTREMLYTAVTRSKRSVTIVGSPEVFKLGIHRTINRFSGMAEKLRKTSS